KRGKYRYAFLCGNHHQYTFYVIALKQDMRLIPCLLIQFQKMKIPKGISVFRKSHINDRFLCQFFSPKHLSAGKGMTVVQHYSQRRSFHTDTAGILVFCTLFTVPCKDDIIVSFLKAGLQDSCIPAIAGDQDVWIFIMKNAEPV